MWYHVSKPNTYLVITGAGVENVRIKKKAFVMPFQKVTEIAITPFEFPLALQAMTSEKLKFSLPAVFTIGPQDDPEALIKYSVLLSGNSEGQINQGTISTGRSHVQDIVKGIIEGETRAIVSTMTMEEIFNKRQVFKDKVIKCVQSELDQFGLKVYNANVKELQDTDGSQYFAFLSKKAHEGAQNQAKVDVANARMIGEVGEAEKQGQTKQKIAIIHAQTAVLETERKVEKAAADARLKSREIEIERELNLERIAATRMAEERDAELLKVVEQKKAEKELERLRATVVTQARIAKESAQEHADGEFYRISKSTDAENYRISKSTDAEAYRISKSTDAAIYKQRANADVDFHIKERAAEAQFITKKREAEALYIVRQQEAAGLEQLAKAYTALAEPLGGPRGLMEYLMLQAGVFEKLADSSARAIQGLQPKINVWTTGSGEGADPTAPIRNLFQAIPPIASTLFDQTGMAPPAWMMQMPKEEQAQSNGVDAKALMKQKMANGVSK
ncbi:hypothetical protein AAFC00_001112 [Neodothiora populina]|uniref:Band 7 domain-containing protein n=1 Tax=Neodothiora populina TaxID=2781224 RepID=A0ABR3PMU6_9PEZI